jgi:peptidoglycan/xylan/chitin deacetylase (PgdA/CDA1 family)
VLKKIHNHLELIKQAKEEAEKDLTQSAKTLQRVFGDDEDGICFPLPEDLEESESNAKSRSNVREAPPFA